MVTEVPHTLINFNGENPATVGGVFLPVNRVHSLSSAAAAAAAALRLSSRSFFFASTSAS